MNIQQDLEELLRLLEKNKKSTPRIKDKADVEELE